MRYIYHGREADHLSGLRSVSPKAAGTSLYFLTATTSDEGEKMDGLGGKMTKEKSRNPPALTDIYASVELPPSRLFCSKDFSRIVNFRDAVYIPCSLST